MRSLFIPVVVGTGLLVAACNNEQKTNAAPDGPRLTEKYFGMADKDSVKEFTLTNASGMQVSIINYGGAITKLITKDRNGTWGDVALGFKSLDGYIQQGNPYIGGLIGRYGNRIAKGKFTLDGKLYQLAANNGANALHGCKKGFDKVVWSVEKIPGDSSIKLSRLSKDGEEGYPGDLSVTVMYTLTSQNELRIEYRATTSKSTPVNLTNHCYFNLSAGKDSTILDHELMLKANQFTEVDDELIPTGRLPYVKNTPMDFSVAKRIGRDIDSVKGGYDHNWVLDKKENELTLAATLCHPASGRLMEVYTTEPGVQFYSGNFLDGTLKDTKTGQPYVRHAGLCLETQHFPDSPNQPSFPNTILHPGETYTQTSIYKFLVK